MIRQIKDLFSVRVETEIEQYRYNTFFDKEPETLAWIESMPDGAVFWDVGANIGLYSLYAAALHPYVRVHAFEPYLPNFARLFENKSVNELLNLFIYHLAVGAIDDAVSFYVPKEGYGESGGQILRPRDEHGTEFTPAEKSVVMCYTLDSLRNNFIGYSPTHLKIDVDGQEWRVIEGGIDVLNVGSLQSILVECNHDVPQTAEMIETILGAGFTRDDRFDNLPKHSSQRRGGNPENIVFSR